ncbi:hypothetical protein VUR80DRAFT_1155 [Thermomyces stellatus]
MFGGPTSMYIISLDNNTATKPELRAAEAYGSQMPIASPGGAYYFHGPIYLALVGNEKELSNVVAVDPDTHVVTLVVNSYFGIELPSADDVIVTYTQGSHGIEKHIYFSTLGLTDYDPSVGLADRVLPNVFWKFTPETQTLQSVMTRGDVQTPNGVEASKDFRHLFVIDTSAPSVVGGGGPMKGSPAIYRYDISPEDGLLSNKALFGITRQGVWDGINVDDKGRVWTGEYEGIVVRNPTGKMIGELNKVFLGSGEHKVEMTNFALAGDTLVVLAPGSHPSPARRNSTLAGGGLVNIKGTFNITNKNFVSTGGGRRIGYAAVLAIAEMDGNVSTDVASEESLGAGFEEAVSRFKTLDGLVTAAGVVLERPFTSFRRADASRTMDISVRCSPPTVTGTFFAAQLAAKNMTEDGNGGSVVLIASVSGSVATPAHRMAPYNVSRGAVEMLGTALASSWGRRTSALTPSWRASPTPRC